MPRLTLIGKPLESSPEPQLGTYLNVRTLSSHNVSIARGTDTQPVTVDAPDDAIVKVDYENGVTEWLRADQFVQEIGEHRGAGDSYAVPSALDRGVTTRGAGAWVLKALHVLGISPADAIAHETAKGVVEHFEGKMQTGLHRLLADGSFGERIDKPGQLDNSAPYLLFVHGTASSTKGSFSGFWSNDAGTTKATSEWSQMLDRYKNRILALEHATFSVSPAQNALDGAKLLPEGATIHLITHSRGGLVGELLCLGLLKEEELSAFAGRDDQKLLLELGKVLDEKKFQVSKFVRAACPAAGTILAGKRMDLYLNILLNAIGHIPGLAVSTAYDLFKASALELIKLRADPATLPGIEAMMPESPLIHFLNTKGRSTKADLGIIAGNFEGSGFWGTLKSYALRAYYWEDNDIVVNTRSMMGGMERATGVWQYFEEGDEVNHFHYFRNLSTRSEILKWLSSAAPVAEFKRVRGLEAPEIRAVRENVPVVWIVPDLFATQLSAAGKPIWLDYDALAAGQFTKLAGNDVEVGKVLDVYQGLAEKLAWAYQVKDFPYDWRKAISEAAAKLATQVTADGDRPVHFIGHGMGGLILREFMRSKNNVWENLRKKGSKVVMLGTPNLGSWQIARLLWGRGELLRMLALLGRHPESDLVGVLRSFPGLLDMLPDAMLETQQWQSSSLARPEPAHLAASRQWQKGLGKASDNIDGVFYLAGTADATPSGLDEYTSAGDGQVTYESGAVSELRTWYDEQHAHGDLPDSTEAIFEILSRGTASSLGAMPRTTTVALDSRRLSLRDESAFFPSEQDLVNAALGKSGKVGKKLESTLRVRITHGQLREAAHPVLVGHYMGDAIVSAEAELDRRLEERLSTRFHMETYAGPLGTVEIVRVPTGDPPGALVIGLGEVGELTTEKLRKGALEACLRYAMARSEDSECPDATSGEASEANRSASAVPRSAAISSLLVGVSGGSFLSVKDSIAAITQAALEANRTLSRRKLLGKVRIDEIEFVELYEDTAIEAAHAIANLPILLNPDLQAGERLDAIASVRQVGGGRFRKPYDSFNAGWWRRIQIENGDEGGTSGLDQALQTISKRIGQAQSAASDTNDFFGAATANGRTRLVFTALTDRARLEETVTLSQSKIANSLITDSISRIDYDKEAAAALFELLIPNAFKDQARENGDLVLMLDGVAAQYPWELMTDRMKLDEQPLAVQSGMIRQFKTIHWERISGPRGAREHNALVIGDTESGLPSLPGAQEEAKEVARLLEGSGYYATPPLIKQPAGEIIRKLFAADYRIVHLAGHGVFTADQPEHTGMVLGRSMYLSPLEFEQMRVLPELVFVNCCHLGQFERGGRRINADNPGALAASVAQTLIQKGVKAVIAAGWAVDDAAARTFAITFYASMLEGTKFGEAVKRARHEAYRNGSTNTWGAYQCYGNPDFALSLRPISSGGGTVKFYSRRENIDELRDIAAEAKGSQGQVRENLQQRVQRLDKDLPSAWRDGEVLCLLGEAYKELREFAAAIPIFQEAIGRPKANARIETVEQLANCIDRRAKQLSKAEPAVAQKMWEEAQRLLENLNTTLGESSERLSLLGALWKRRGEAQSDPTSEDAKRNFEQSADFYRRAYLHTRKWHNEVDVYSGLNWMTVSYLSRTPADPERDTAMKECLEQSPKLKGTPNFWDRVHEPDALLLSYLFANTLHQHVDEVVDKYKRVFQFAGPVETDSVTGQWKFMQRTAPNESLNRLIDLLDHHKNGG